MFFEGTEKPESERTEMGNRISIISLVAIVSTMQEANANLTLSIDGKSASCQKSGRGCVDAVFNAVNELFHNDAVLEDYHAQLAHPGTDTDARVQVTLSVMGRQTTAEGVHPDTVIASAYAYVEALNQLYS